jgi:hypothetical protein
MLDARWRSGTTPRCWLTLSDDLPHEQALPCQVVLWASSGPSVELMANGGDCDAEAIEVRVSASFQSSIAEASALE